MLHIISKLRKMGTVVVTILLVACMTMRPVASRTAFSTSAKKETIKPCEDFFRHVCAKSIRIAKWEQLEERAALAKTEAVEYLRKAVKGTDSYLVKWAKRHFKACMNKRSLNEIGVRPLAHIVKYASDFGWNILGKNPENYWVPVHNSYSRLTGQGALFTVNVDPDEKYEKNVIIISPTEDLFLRHVSKSNPEDIPQYMDFLTDIWTAYANDQGHPTYSRKSVQNAIRDVLNFRQAIIDKRNPLQSISNITAMTLSDLDEYTRRIMEKKNLDWPRFLQTTFQNLGNYKFNDTNVVHIRRFSYVKVILKAIASTPVKVLLNHIHFNFCERFIQYTSVNMTARFYQMLKQPLPERSITCVSSNVMKKVVNFVYVKKFLTNYTMPTAVVVARNVQEMLMREISRTDWIDNETASVAVRKLDEIREEFGSNIWYKYQRKLMFFYYYRTRITNDTNYFNNILDFETTSYRYALRKLWLPATEEEFHMEVTDPFDMNAAASYIYETNRLVLPPVLLQYIQSPAPKVNVNVTNYGAFGTIVGYSLSRALDSLGRQYDSRGKQTNWWGNATLNEYNRRLQCYLERFQEASLRAGLNLNFTVGRNDYSDEVVAEYMGVVAAFKTYKYTAFPRVETEASSRFHSNMDQVFFRAYAARQCKAPIGTDARLPHGLRVNTALSNMRPFADAFGCKKTDPMYSSKKCKWLDESQI